MNPTFIRYTFAVSLPESPVDGERIHVIARDEDEAFDRALVVAQRLNPFAALSRVDSEPSTSVEYVAQEAKDLTVRKRHAAKEALRSFVGSVVRLGTEASR